ncbi:MAG: NAD-dependent epimerase/dehydratase family protein, partial [Luteolibacter sp.]
METRRRAGVVGVTGFIGRGLPILLKNAGYDVTGISRTSSASIPGVETWQKLSTATFANHQAIINLAGDRIDRRWPAENRRRQYERRI